VDRESVYPVRSAIEGANFLHGSEVRRSIPQEGATTYEIGRGKTEGSTQTGEAITKSRTTRGGAPGRLTASAGAAAQSTAGEEVEKTPDSGGGGRRPEEEVEASWRLSSFPLKIYPGFSLLI
jgi:hypothetical protein